MRRSTPTESLTEQQGGLGGSGAEHTHVVESWACHLRWQCWTAVQSSRGHRRRLRQGTRIWGWGSVARAVAAGGLLRAGGVAAVEAGNAHGGPRPVVRAGSVLGLGYAAGGPGGVRPTSGSGPKRRALLTDQAVETRAAACRGGAGYKLEARKQHRMTDVWVSQRHASLRAGTSGSVPIRLQLTSCLYIS